MIPIEPEDYVNAYIGAMTEEIRKSVEPGPTGAVDRLYCNVADRLSDWHHGSRGTTTPLSTTWANKSGHSQVNSNTRSAAPRNPGSRIPRVCGPSDPTSLLSRTRVDCVGLALRLSEAPGQAALGNADRLGKIEARPRRPVSHEAILDRSGGCTQLASASRLAPRSTLVVWLPHLADHSWTAWPTIGSTPDPISPVG
jgi:hypothetical protein